MGDMRRLLEMGTQHAMDGLGACISIGLEFSDNEHYGMERSDCIMAASNCATSY